MFPEHSAKIKRAAGNAENTRYSQRDIDQSESTQPEDITLGITVGAEDDDILPLYETYNKKKFPYRNVFMKVLPSPQQMAKIKEQVEEQIKDLEKETQVSLQEKQLQIQQAVEAGEMIPDRAQLEIERAQKMAAQALEEQKAMLMAQAQDAATTIENRIMTEASYRVIKDGGKMGNQIVDAIKFYENRIVVTCSVGDDVLLYEHTLPVSEYPIIPISYMYTGTPYPMSAIVPLIGKQQEINKAHQIMLHNANLASNLRWMYEEGSVPEEEWERYSSAPGALLKYRQGFNAPTPVMPAPINNAFFSVVQEGKGDAEYIAGVPSAMMGFTQQQSETYRGLLANDEFGTRRLKAWMGSIAEPALEHLGQCFQMFSQSHYTVEKVFRIVQPEAGQQPDQEKESRINVPIYNDFGKAIGKFKDYASAKFDVRLIAGATMPINRWALLEEYFRWFQAGLIDDIAMIGETDIRNKKSIVERKSMYAQLQSQVASMEEAMKDKEGTIETLERQLVQAGIKLKVGEGNTEVRKSVLETEAQQKLLRGMLKTEFEKEKMAIKNEVKGNEKAS
jgi:hypothetical protein